MSIYFPVKEIYETNSRSTSTRDEGKTSENC